MTFAVESLIYAVRKRSRPERKIIRLLLVLGPELEVSVIFLAPVAISLHVNYYRIDSVKATMVVLVFGFDFLLTAVPGHVSVSTKYVIVNLDDCHCGSLSIAVAVECRCQRTVCLSAPTPHKPTQVLALDDWV